jgi:hypothetical protein
MLDLREAEGDETDDTTLGDAFSVSVEAEKAEEAEEAEEAEDDENEFALSEGLGGKTPERS